MKTIGGYFELERNYGDEYHKRAIALVSGRACLRYLIRANQIRKISLPWFLCNCVEQACYEEGVEVSYYRIQDDFQPCDKITISPDTYLYMVNAYGRIDNQTLSKWKTRFPQLIMDNTQAFFQTPLPGVDTIYSCRKYFGVPDGAYLYSDAAIDKPIPVAESRARMGHLLGRMETTAEAYYKVYKENDDGLAGMELQGMSELTHNLLRGIDYERVRAVRSRNYGVLAHRLGEQNLLSSGNPDGAFCYPFLHPRGAELKIQLIEHKIFVPTYWPNVLSERNRDSTARYYAENIIPIPCDQRYEEGDMQYILDILLQFTLLKEKQPKSPKFEMSGGSNG